MNDGSGLNLFFNPKSIAVIGASARKGTVGYVIVEQLKKKFRGKIYPITPKYPEILGIKTYPSILDVPDEVDLAVIALRAALVPRIMRDVGEKGVRAVIIVSGGFSETGEEGAKLEREVLEIAKKYNIRVIGPNCIGVLDNYSGVDTFFLPEERLKRPPKGHIAIISQSGAMLSMWIDWMALKGMGLSKAISYGNKIDVEDVELLEFLERDPNTKIILMYIEALKPGKGRKFIEVARRIVSKGKPIIVLKGGRTRKGEKAAASHTGAMAAGYNIYRAAFRQAGIIEVDTMDEMFDIAKAFIMLGPAQGRRLLILTNAGGEGVIASDFAERYGLDTPEPPEEVKKILREKFPPHVIVKNPLDLTGDTDDERYRIALEELLSRNLYDIVVVITPPHPPSIKGYVIDYVVDAWKKYQVPIIAVVTGGAISEEFAKKIEEKGIPSYQTPERAVRVAAALADYGVLLKQQ